jgi:solute carrier family 25 phosphate transporter 23/24/25/41
MPAHEPGLKAVLSYFSAGVKVNPEGDVSISDEPKHTIGTTHNVLSDIRSSLFGALAIILSPPIRDRPPELPATSQHNTTKQPHSHHPDDMSSESQTIVKLLSTEAEKSQLSSPASQHATSKLLPMPPLTAFLPGPGFFAAGAISGIVSRTTTAPLDRLKVYLIAQTDNASQALDAVKGGKPLQATKHAVQPLMNACKELWYAGGMRSLFAGKFSCALSANPRG